MHPHSIKISAALKRQLQPIAIVVNYFAAAIAEGLAVITPIYSILNWLPISACSVAFNLQLPIKLSDNLRMKICTQLVRV